MTIVGIIGGTSADFSFERHGETVRKTPWGEVVVVQGSVGATEVLFVRRHGRGHERLSSAVEHRANVSALKDAGAAAILATTVCGLVDPEMPLGRAIVFDDLFFPGNRLPNGAACTMYDEPGDPRRGHFIFGSPFSAVLRSALLEAGDEAGIAPRAGGTYAYMLGPRFNSRAEIAWLRSVGACAVSQTAGPEAVLAGELEIPYALVGFGVDYANGVKPEPTPVEVLDANIASSRDAFDAIVMGAVRRLDDPVFDTGFVYRFE